MPDDDEYAADQTELLPSDDDIPVKDRKNYEFSDLVEHEGKFLCPECGESAGSPSGIIGMYTHLRIAHSIMAKINGAPRVKRAPRFVPPPYVAPQPPRTYNLIQSGAIEHPEQTHTVVEPKKETPMNTARVSEQETVPAMRLAENSQSESNSDELAMAIIDLNNRIDAILLPRNVEYMSKQYVDGILTVQHLLATMLEPFIPGIVPIQLPVQSK
jgi:hypothetical protein